MSVGYFCDLLHRRIVIFPSISYPDGNARARRECAFNRIWHLPLSSNRSDSFYSSFLEAHGAVKHAVSSMFISAGNSKAKIRRNRYGRYGRIDKVDGYLLVLRFSRFPGRTGRIWNLI